MQQITLRYHSSFVIPSPFSFTNEKYLRLKFYQKSNFYQMANVISAPCGKNFSSKIYHMEILPVLIFKEAAIIRILVASSKI